MNKKFMGDYRQAGLEPAAAMAIVHVPDEPKQGLQRCKRCGQILLRLASPAHAALPVGSNLTVDGSVMTLGAQPGAKECKPA